MSRWGILSGINTTAYSGYYTCLGHYFHAHCFEKGCPYFCLSYVFYMVRPVFPGAKTIKICLNLWNNLCQPCIHLCYYSLNKGFKSLCPERLACMPIQCVGIIIKPSYYIFLLTAAIWEMIRRVNAI